MLIEVVRARASILNTICLVLAALLLMLSYDATVQTGRAKPNIPLSDNGSRTIEGLAAVLSHADGAPMFTAYSSYLAHLRTGEFATIEQANGRIRDVEAQRVPRSAPELILGNDDKGVVYWYAAGFALFGHSIEGVLAAYYFFLGCSFLVMAVGFWGRPAYVLSGAFVVTACLALMDLVNTHVSSPVINSVGTRQFAMLAFLPAFHIGLTLVDARALSKLRIAAAAIQILLLVLFIQVRSSTSVFIPFIFAAAGCGLFLLLRREGREAWRKAAALTLLAIAPVVIGGLVSAWQQNLTSRLEGAWSNPTAGHIVWHNVIAGMVVAPDAKAELDQWAARGCPSAAAPEHDLAALCGIGAYFREAGGESAHRAEVAAALGKSPDADRLSRWLFSNVELYEEYGKRFFFHELRSNPAMMVSLYVETKTSQIIQLARAPNVGPLTFAFRSIYLAPVLVLAALFGALWLTQLRTIGGVALLAMPFAVMPLYLFAPADHLMFDSAPVLLFLAYALIATLVAAVVAGARRLVVSGGIAAELRAMRSRLTAARAYAVSRDGKRAGFAVFGAACLALAVFGAGSARSALRGLDPAVIHVVSATYGGSCAGYVPPPPAENTVRAGNATQAVQRSCPSGRCDYLVDVNVLRDPANSCGKDFEVTWRCGMNPKLHSKYIPQEANGRTVRLICPYGAGGG